MSELMNKILERPDSKEIATEHLLEGYLYSHYVKKEFKKQWLANFVGNNIRLEELFLLNNCLENSNYDVIILKGMALIDNTYEDIGQRCMGDVDLLVTKKNINDLEKKLIKLGYHELKQRKWWANDFKKIYQKKIEGLNVVIELHTKLFYTQTDNFCWKVKSCSNPKLNNFKLLAPSEQFFHLIGHLSFQHTFLHLNWLLDLEIFVNKYRHEIDFKQVSSMAKSFRIYNSFMATLYCLNTYADTRIDSEHLTTLAQNLRSRLSFEFLLNPKNKPLQYYKIKHLLKDDFYSALRYDLGWLGDKLNGVLGKK